MSLSLVQVCPKPIKLYPIRIQLNCLKQYIKAILYIQLGYISTTQYLLEALAYIYTLYQLQLIQFRIGSILLGGQLSLIVILLIRQQEYIILSLLDPYLRGNLVRAYYGNSIYIKIPTLIRSRNFFFQNSISSQIKSRTLDTASLALAYIGIQYIIRLVASRLKTLSTKISSYIINRRRAILIQLGVVALLLIIPGYFSNSLSTFTFSLGVIITSSLFNSYSQRSTGNPILLNKYSSSSSYRLLSRGLGSCLFQRFSFVVVVAFSSIIRGLPAISLRRLSLATYLSKLLLY